MKPLCFTQAPHCGMCSSRRSLRSSSVSAPFPYPSLSAPRRRYHPSYRNLPHPVVIASTAAPVLRDVSVILLAGGTGSRMKAHLPKQFLPLAGMPVVEHSLLLFAGMPEVTQLVVVVEAQFRDAFARHVDHLGARLVFADPGRERQDSVFNGLQQVADGASLACVHDAARPLVTAENVRDVLRDAMTHGAAVLGVPSKATIKESADGSFVLRTIPRKRLWEIQTPQVIRPELLRKGFRKVRTEGLEVTDDVSIVEYLGEPVKITMGEYTNIKLTTPEDMNIAESILRQRAMTSKSKSTSTSTSTSTSSTTSAILPQIY